MAQHHIVEWVGVIALFLFGITMMVQGHFIVHNKHGYSRKDHEDQDHRDYVRRQMEEIIKGK